MFNRGNVGTRLLIFSLIVIILLQFGFILYGKYYKRPFFLSNLFYVQEPTPTIVKVDEEQVKKDSLEKFYKELLLADNTKDYEKLYSIMRPYLGVWISKREFISNEKNVDSRKKIASSEAIIHSMKVEGDKGLVDRTIIQCLTEKCIGKDREENHAVREFKYINNEWSYLPDKEPSERALKAATYLVISGTAQDREEVLGDFGYGTNRDEIAIHFMAIKLDEHVQNLVSVETYIEKLKTNASRPIVNYDAPAVNYQPPDVNINVPRQNNSLNCTSNKIGNYTYTNCF